jgi:hypothetical protein
MDEPEIIIGVGKILHVSYWLTLLDGQNNVVWHGMINATERTNDNGEKMLEVGERPPGIEQAYQHHRQLQAKWIPAWEEVNE